LACPLLTDTQSGCNPTVCPQPCVVSNWTDYSPCTQSCGGGDQSRSRHIISGRFLQKASETVAHNFAKDEPGERYFDRLLTSDGPLSERMRKTFHTRALTASVSYLTELDSWLSKVAYEPNEPLDRRYGVGVFFFEERGDGTAHLDDEQSAEPREL